MYSGFLLLSTVGCIIHNAESRTRCPRKVQFENGKLYVKRTRTGQIGTYRCDLGFKEYGEKITKCVDGKWNVQPPVCIAPGCDLHLAVVTNGRVVNLHQDKGDLLELHCLAGYRLEGNNFIWCNGTDWSQDFPICILKTTTSSEVTTVQTTFKDIALSATTPSVQPTREYEVRGFTADDITTSDVKVTGKAIEDFIITSTTYIPEKDSRHNSEMRTETNKIALIIGLPLSVVAIIGCCIMFAMYRRQKYRRS